MKLKMKKIDWKKLMLEKGEKIGLYTCLAIMGLLVVFGLFWPGNGFFSGSATENASKLEVQNREADRRIREANPDSRELASLKDIKDSLLRSGELAKADPDLWRANQGYFIDSRGEDSRRRAPVVLEPVEWKTAVVLSQARKYIFDPAFKQVLMLRGYKDGAFKNETTTASKNFKTIQKQNLPAQAAAGGGIRGTGLGARPANPELGLPNTTPEKPGTPFENAKPTAKAEFVDLDKIDAVKDGRLAEDILPLRQALIVGSFPLKKQLERFQQALRLPTLDQVIADREFGEEKAVQKTRLPQFQFVSLNIERREIGRNGKPGEWVDPKIDGAYRQLVVLNGRRWEKDNDELAPIILQGLVMPLPLQFRENQYPRLETQLKTIDSTLVELKKQNTAGQAVPKPASRFTSEGFNPFGGGEDPADKPMEDKPMTGKPGEKPGEKPEWTPPEHCLIRICDITIEPGKTYEYRFQIRMVNPNYQHPNVVKKDLANDRELKSAWFEVKDESGEPIKVVVPPEAHFYASDYRPAGLSKHQTVVQYQRWLENVKPNPKSLNEFTVADWVVADTLVNRGEYLTRTEEKSQPKIEVPIWMYTQEAFVLANNPTEFSPYDRTKIPVPFSPGSGDYLLVDFQGGTQRHSRMTDLAADKPRALPSITDRAPVELLYLSPDGKLLARDSETDKHDKERDDRTKQYKQRLEEAKHAAKKPEDPKKP